MPIDEVSGDGHREFAAELIALEPLQRVTLAIRAQQNVELILRHWVLGGQYARTPTQRWHRTQIRYYLNLNPIKC